MKFTAEQIADILNGEVIGNPAEEVNQLSKIDEGAVGALTFLSNPKYTPHIYTTKSSVVIVDNDFEPEKEVSVTLIKVKSAYKAFSEILEYYSQIKLNKKGISKTAYISDSAKLGQDLYISENVFIGENVVLGNNVKIFPNCYVGDNVTIGDDTVLFSGAKLYSDCIIGKKCVINSCAIIGCDGFGFAPDGEGSYVKIPQIGNVIIEDNVDIGASTTIDRATLGSTVIKEGVKLDNQIQIAHNVEIGEHTVIAAQTGVAGSTKIGKRCQIGGQVGVAGHLTIGDNVKIQAQSGIARNVKDNEVLQGSPSLPYSDYNKSYVHFKNLGQLVKKINELEKKLNNGNS